MGIWRAICTLVQRIKLKLAVHAHHKKAPLLPKIHLRYDVMRKFIQFIHPRFNRPAEIVIHGSAGGFHAPNILRVRLTQHEPFVTHYLIDLNGIVYETVPPSQWVDYPLGGTHDDSIIGIELVNPDPRNAAPYTAEQYSSLARLVVNVLIDKYPGIRHIVSHSHNVSHGSDAYGIPCPGEGFDWYLFREVLGHEPISVNSFSDQEIYIR